MLPLIRFIEPEEISVKRKYSVPADNEPCKLATGTVIALLDEPAGTVTEVDPTAEPCGLVSEPPYTLSSTVTVMALLAVA